MPVTEEEPQRQICFQDFYPDVKDQEDSLSCLLSKANSFLENTGIPGEPYVQTTTVGSRSIQPPDVFPLISIVNKSCNIERCVNSMLPIIQNLIVSQGLELILSMCRRTTMSDQRTLI